MQMEFDDKAYHLKKAKMEFGLYCPGLDVTMLETSKDTPVMSTGVKINPFNMEKGLLIKESFDLAKLAWATVVITTEPENQEVEADIFFKIKVFNDSQVAKPKHLSALSKQLQSVVKVSRQQSVHK